MCTELFFLFFNIPTFYSETARRTVGTRTGEKKMRFEQSVEVGSHSSLIIAHHECSPAWNAPPKLERIGWSNWPEGNSQNEGKQFPFISCCIWIKISKALLVEQQTNVQIKNLSTISHLHACKHGATLHTLPQVELFCNDTQLLMMFKLVGRPKSDIKKIRTHSTDRQDMTQLLIYYYNFMKLFPNSERCWQKKGNGIFQSSYARSNNKNTGITVINLCGTHCDTAQTKTLIVVPQCRHVPVLSMFY